MQDRPAGAVRSRLFLIPVVLAVLVSEQRCVITANLLPAEKRQNYQYTHGFDASDPAFRRSMGAFGRHMTSGNSVKLLLNGDQIFPVMTDAIRGARTSVNLESYIFTDDRAGRLFADALMETSRRGVEVRALLDASGGKAGSLYQEMEKAGVKVRIYRPIKLWTIHKLDKRTHRKILVIDGRRCFTGGLGIDDRWLGNAGNPKEWRDTQVDVSGPVAAQMQAIFAENWTFTTGEILAGDKFYPSIEPAGDVPAQAIKISRGDSSSLSKMLYFVAIHSAARSIHLQNAYFLPDEQMLKALLEARKRGVEIQIMVPGPHIDLPPVRAASRNKYGELLLAGVKIYEYMPTMLHNKTLIVDGIFSTVGSINFDSRSMGRNDEESLAFYDRGFAAQVDAMFVADLAKCRELTYQDWKERGLGQRLAEKFWWFWEPLY